MNFVHSMGYDIFSDNLSKIELTNDCKVLSTMSPNSYAIAEKDSVFKKSLVNSDFIVLDGVYFGLAAILTKRKIINTNNGPSVYDFFIKKMNLHKGRVFFLGSTQDTLDKIKNRLTSDYPDVTAGFFSPPFKNVFSVSENEKMITAINKFKPDILFLGMTCPKQEIWAHNNSKFLDTKLVCSIGAVFDWYAGNIKQIHPLWWKFNLAWLKRTIDRPEIIKRWPNVFFFFWHLFLVFFKIKQENNH
jgi:N-acetylglucosaminyldiphosphoundecaprenol N-acetyl-beta-D-mannosaminyltransferase